MRRRLKNGAVFFRGEISGLFLCPEKFLKNFQKSGTICVFHIVLYVRAKEKSFFPVHLNDRPNGETTLPRPLCAGASEATPEKKLGQELRSGKRQI